MCVLEIFYFKNRIVSGATESITDILNWVGIKFDPFVDKNTSSMCSKIIQSSRLDLYHSHAEILLQDGSAFKCYCSKHDSSECQKNASAPCDERCRFLSHAEKQSLLNSPYVIRLKVSKPFNRVTFLLI